MRHTAVVVVVARLVVRYQASHGPCCSGARECWLLPMSLLSDRL